MATLKQCEGALQDLARKLNTVDPDARARVLVDRSLSCELTDLGQTFRGTLRDGGLHDISVHPAVDGKQPPAQVRMRTTSDDLLALTAGQLNFASAWLSGKVRIDASITDIIKLRALI